MSDEAKCIGVKANNVECPLREKCRRYLLPAQEHQWYTEAAFVNNKCDLFIENIVTATKKNKKQQEV